MRIKRMGVSFELVKTVFAQDNIIPETKVIRDGLPADAVPCGVFMHDGIIWVDIQSDSFEEVEAGTEIPMLNPSFETLQRQ